MAEDSAKTEVLDNPLEHRYEVWHGDKLAGFSAYRLREDHIVFVHTEIGEAFEGKGLGGVLARHAIEDSIDRGLVIVPLCPFISAYLRKHPEYGPHVRWPEGSAGAEAAPGA